jgi:hypothetical protein
MEIKLRLVEDVTKMTHLLVVVYMTLFKDYTHGKLKESDVRETLIFLKALWLKMADALPEKVTQLCAVDMQQI